MNKVCEVCGNLISPHEVHFQIGNKFFHQSILDENSNKRYCYEEYEQMLRVEQALSSIRKSGW